MSQTLDLFADLAPATVVVDAAAPGGVQPSNYRITAADQLGAVSRGAGLWRNVQALRVLKTLETGNRVPTAAERACLVRYAGWGGFKEVFRGTSARTQQDRETYAALRELLTDEEYNAARDGVLNAFYTPPELIASIYRLVEHFGFGGGRILEPSVGVGHFIGSMPDALAATSVWSACDLDPIVTRIAKHLYPDADIRRCGFQENPFALGAFDLAISNVPFGDERIIDPSPHRKDMSGVRIHNYFAARMLAHLRPGGILAMVTTRRFLDARDGQGVKLLHQGGEFLGAIRLPGSTFAAAHTSVVSDLVFYRKCAKGHTPVISTPENLAEVKEGSGVWTNQYFLDHPSHVAGSLDIGTGQGGRAELTVHGDGAALERAVCALMEAVKAEPVNGPTVVVPVPASVEAVEALPPVLLDQSDVPVGGYFLDGDQIYLRGDDDADGNPSWTLLSPDLPWSERATLGKQRYARIEAMLRLRESAYELVNAERRNAPVPMLDQLRAALRTEYEQFVKRFGRINDPANFRLIKHDPRIECGLEVNYKRAITPAVARRTGAPVAGSTAEPSALLTQRVYTPKKVVQEAESLADAVNICMCERARIDLARIAGLIGESEGATKRALIEQGYAFVCPETGALVDHHAYLSGDVRAKLRACGTDARFDANRRALEAVLPADIPADQIFLTLGALWIPEDIYRDFAKTMGVISPVISHSAALGRVSIAQNEGFTQNEVNLPWLNDDYSPAELFNKLSAKQPLIAYDWSTDVHGKRVRVINAERTKTLRSIEPRINDFFVTWAWSDPERSERLTRTYNDLFNTHAKRSYDSRLLNPVGASPSIELRDSQKAGAWRAIVSPVTLLDHVVGAGKTFTIVTAIMERRRMGLSKKPLIAVPNHLLGQWAAAFYQLYPAAQLLVANEQDFTRTNRRRLFARMATTSPDCILIGHSSLGFIPQLPETEIAHATEEVDYLMRALEQAKANGDSSSVRVLVNRKKKLEARMESLEQMPRDNVLCWEELGVDLLAVDEIHKYKNLAYATTMRGIVGMGDPEGSKRAWDFYVKSRILLGEGGALITATGTPISNSAVEMFGLLRVHNREALKARDLDSFDAWAKTFAHVEQRIEYTATGGVKERTVFASFNNLPEMRQLYTEFADEVSQDDLRNVYAEQMKRANQADGGNRSLRFPVPDMTGGKRILDVADPNPTQSAYMDYLVARSKVCEEHGGDPMYRTIDNPLWITNDARKMALDARMVDPMAQGSETDKVSRCARRVLEIAGQWEAERGTQLVFCDLSTPTGGAEKAARAALRKAAAIGGVHVPAGANLTHQWSKLQQRLRSVADGDGSLAKAADKFLDEKTVEITAQCMTADSGFSAYDALKEALVQGGMEPHEVRFIHSAKTTGQREELFELVREGVVRVLIGSTAKMGEGMNVQKRLVALHHLDAPWRPSDVTQRDGRGLRQGNMFYERDPDNFTIGVFAYSTGRTFDAVMWQILERKAAMLEQFRSGARSISEDCSDAKSYAEFMAISSGNPAFRRKLELEREIETLQGEMTRIAAQRSSAQHALALGPQRRAEAEAAVIEGHRAVAAFAEEQLIATLRGRTYALDDWEGPLNSARKQAEKRKGPKPQITSDQVCNASQWACFIRDLAKVAEDGGLTSKRISFAVNGERFELCCFPTSSGKHRFDLLHSYGVLMETSPRSAFPSGDLLDALTPASLRAFSERVLDRMQRNFTRTCERIADAERLLENLQFNDQDRLDDAMQELECVIATVRRLEQEAEDARDISNNPFALGDVIRRRYLMESAAANEEAIATRCA